jgi:hypothetical protein
MIDVTLHPRGQHPQRRKLTAIPPRDSFIRIDGELHHVMEIVVGEKRIDLYVNRVGKSLATELKSKWAGWGEPLDPDTQQGGMKGQPKRFQNRDIRMRRKSRPPLKQKKVKHENEPNQTA